MNIRIKDSKVFLKWMGVEKGGRNGLVEFSSLGDGIYKFVFFRLYIRIFYLYALNYSRNKGRG